MNEERKSIVFDSICMGQKPVVCHIFRKRRERPLYQIQKGHIKKLRAMTLVTLALSLLLSAFGPDGSSTTTQTQSEQQSMQSQGTCDYIITDQDEM